MSLHASPQQAEWALRSMREQGHIHDYKRVYSSSGLRWRVETFSPTRREHYNDPEAKAVLVFTTREVFAFREGVWSAIKFIPTNRAGSVR